MEKQIQLIEDWLAGGKEDFIREMPGKTIAQQLQAYDAAGTGIGFILVLQPQIGETDKNDEIQGEINLVAVPVIKVHNKWYTTTDVDVAEIVAAVIRIVSRNVQ